MKTEEELIWESYTNSLFFEHISKETHHIYKMLKDVEDGEYKNNDDFDDEEEDSDDFDERLSNTLDYLVTDVNIAKNQWFLHATDTKVKNLKGKLQGRVTGHYFDFENLAYFLLSQSKKGGYPILENEGYLYCYPLTEHFQLNRINEYGSNIIMLMGNGVTFHHEGDDEWQSIVNVKDISDIVIIDFRYRVLFKDNKYKEFNTLLDAVTWVYRNYSQYKNKFFSLLDYDRTKASSFFGDDVFGDDYLDNEKKYNKLAKRIIKKNKNGEYFFMIDDEMVGPFSDYKKARKEIERYW